MELQIEALRGALDESHKKLDGIKRRNVEIQRTNSEILTQKNREIQQHKDAYAALKKAVDTHNAKFPPKTQREIEQEEDARKRRRSSYDYGFTGYFPPNSKPDDGNAKYRVIIPQLPGSQAQATQ